VNIPVGIASEQDSAPISGVSTVFGPLVSGRAVERAVTFTLKHWMETYLRNRELATGRAEESVARIASWREFNQFDDKKPEDQLPFLVVICPGLAGSDYPKQEGDGGFRAEWEVVVGIIAAAATGQDAKDLVEDVYCPVIRQIMLQKQSLRNWTSPDADPFAAGTKWIDESYEDVTLDADRSLASGQLTFWVEVDNVINRFAGPAAPADPDTQPDSDWPTVATTHLQVVEKV